MLYDAMIRRVIEGVVQLPGSQRSGNVENYDDLKTELTTKGYSFKPIVRDSVSDELYKHNPMRPKASSELAREKVDKAMIRLGQAFFGLGSFTNQMNYVYDHPAVPTAAVDQSGNFYYNSDFVDKLSLGQLTGLIMHEIAHIGMGDLFRQEGLDNKRWNIASDFINNWYIMNDLVNMNATRKSQDRANIPIELPPGGLFPDDDGIVRSMPFSSTERIILPKDKQFDLNNRSTEELYEMLKEIDSNIIDALDEDRFDTHIDKVSINAVDIEIVAGSGQAPGGGGSSKGPITPAKLDGLLVIDKRSNIPAIVIKDDETKKVVSIVQLSPDDYHDVIDQLGITNLPFSY